MFYPHQQLLLGPTRSLQVGMAPKKRTRHRDQSTMSTRLYAERADPDGKIAAQARTFELMTRFPVRQIVRLLGVPQSTFDKAEKLTATYDRLVRELERTARVLAPLGWVVHGLAHAEAYSAAATLVEQGRAEDAEELLVRTYNESDFALIRFYQRVTSLYQQDDRWNEIGLARLRILDEAYELHKEGRYAAAIALVLTQIDGIFIDKTGKSARSFFEPQNENLMDDGTLAGHPLGLRQLSALMSEAQRVTVVTDGLNRHGILHGRVLGYGTLRNATKLWAALLVLIEAVGPGSKWHKG